MADWKALRSEFPLLDRFRYLNTCSLGPPPRSGRPALGPLRAGLGRELSPRALIGVLDFPTIGRELPDPEPVMLPVRQSNARL